MLSKNEKVQKLKEWLAHTQLDANVIGQTLGIHESSVSPQVMVAASAKLIRINKGEEPPDERDNLRYSRFLGLEDYIKEHIDYDAGKLQRKAAQKIQQKKNLSWLQASFFTPQIRSVVIGNPLTQNVDGINPLEHWDNSHRVTKLGPGGIPSIEAVPDESRQIHTSSFGFFDPLHIMESEKVGVTNYISANVVKGKDNKLYRIMKDKDGKLLWVDHERILNSKVGIPEN
jgi:DNA-directed RNA polymerase beta subunit